VLDAWARGGRDVNARAPTPRPWRASPCMRQATFAPAGRPASAGASKLPPRGITLELQARQPGRGWRTVKTTRTRKSGTYSTRYRFNSGFGHFTFRIRLRPNDSYPYSRGTSRPVRVRVG
jgi:hypothetical protein